jgi:hypothetical protein
LLGLFLLPENGRDMLLQKSVNFERTAWRYNPEERTLHNPRCENFKAYKICTILDLTLHSKDRWLVLFGEIIVVYSEKHKEHMFTLHSTYINHCALKG